MRVHFATALILTMLGGCVTAPHDSVPPLLSHAPLEANHEQAPGGFSWPASAWWKEFGDPQLDALIRQALLSAPSLRTAQARIAAAAAAAKLRMADSGTRLGASAGVNRQRLSDDSLISPRLIGFQYYSQADAGLHLDFDLDWWGRERAGIAAALNRAQAAQAERKEAELLLVSAVTSNYLAWQTEGRRLAIARELVATLKAEHELQEMRVAQGIEAADMLEATAMEQAQADDQVTILTGSVALRRLVIASLSGLAPDQLRLDAQGRAVVPYLEQPADAGVGLLSRRPDIVASRWRVEAQTQGVAEARAGYYPDIRLSALGGLSSTELSNFFRAGNRVVSAGAVLYLPIFDAGRVKARYGVQHAELELAIASYNETVVAAAQEVAAQILNGQGLPKHHRYALQRLAAARSLQKAAEDKARQGITDDRARLEAAAEVLRLQDAALQAESEVIQARIALIKSLGGGVDPVTVAVADKADHRNLQP
jgi:multidrug efflux system outer membrane protein